MLQMFRLCLEAAQSLSLVQVHESWASCCVTWTRVSYDTCPVPLVSDHFSSVSFIKAWFSLKENMISVKKDPIVFILIPASFLFDQSIS